MTSEDERGDVWADYMPAGCYVGNPVSFDEGDDEHTVSLGVVTRVWDRVRYVTIRSDGRTFVRHVDRVKFCDHRGHERENLAGWPPDYVCRGCSDWDNDEYVPWFTFEGQSV
jgi:hypothetical protein